MKHLLTSLAFLLGTVSARSEAPVVAGRAGDIEITTAELRENLAGLLAEQKTSLAADPAAVGQYLRALLVQKLVLKQAAAQKWDEDPAVIARLVRARETAIAETFLEAKCKPADSYPSESELQEAYDANKDKLVIPRTYLLAQIYINEPENADAAAKASSKSRLDAVVKQLATRNADFAAIARKTSDDAASAANGGKIGWLAESQIQPGIREKLPDLKPGGVSGPIRLSDGWHIIKMLDIREPRTPTLDEVRDSFVTRLRSERAVATRQEYLSELLKEHPVAINEIELMKLPGTP